MWTLRLSVSLPNQLASEGFNKLAFSNQRPGLIFRPDELGHASGASRKHVVENFFSKEPKTCEGI
jgi:hypothetical protein